MIGNDYLFLVFHFVPSPDLVRTNFPNFQFSSSAEEKAISYCLFSSSSSILSSIPISPLYKQKDQIIQKNRLLAVWCDSDSKVYKDEYKDEYIRCVD